MNNIFDGKICTYYKSIMPITKGSKILATPGVNKPILDILTKEGYTNTAHLTKLRQSGYKSDFYNANKNLLSAATISTVQDDLTITRSDDNTLFHTGFIAFDIDSDKNQMLLHGGCDEMRDYIINNIPYCCYLGKSVSNIGFWGLFAIAYNDEHYAHYRAMKKYFEDRSINIDHTQDISRLRFIAYDPDAHIELSPEIFDLTDDDINTISHLNEYTIPKPNDEFFTACCRWVEAKYAFKFQPGNIHNYLLRLYATLRAAHVKREDCLDWIYKNLIDASLVTTNCLDEVDFKKR